MKRQLTRKEKTLTEKGIKVRSNRIKENKEELKYLNDFHKFNTKWKPYLDKKRKKEEAQKEKYVEMARTKLENEIKFDEEALNSEKLQLKEGVEVKHMPGVD